MACRLCGVAGHYAPKCPTPNARRAPVAASGGPSVAPDGAPADSASPEAPTAPREAPAGRRPITCSRCGNTGHNASGCALNRPPAPRPVTRDGGRRSPTCKLCNTVGHRANMCPSRPDAADLWRPRVHLPLYLNPLHNPTVSRLVPKGVARPFEYLERETVHRPPGAILGTITHRWRAPDGRVITATGPNRPLDCASAEWAWEGHMVCRFQADVADVQAELPSFTVTITEPQETAP